MLPYILDGIPPDLDTSRCTTGERNTPDTGMPDQSRSGGIARPINEVQDTRRKSRILDYLSKYCPISHEPNLPAEKLTIRRNASDLARFRNSRTPKRQTRRDLPG